MAPRFPRDIFARTTLDTETGSISVKHLEPWINPFSAVISFLERCNTDVTSLRSGTAIKAVILYVSNYVTKTSLKTYVMFDLIRMILSRNESLWEGPGTNVNKARSLMTKMVNAMSSRLEIGSPMAAMYLLGLPDHYTDHTFVPFYWQGFVAEVSAACNESMDMDIEPERVMVNKVGGEFLPRSKVDDYINRGPKLEDMSVYEWISRCKAQKIPKRQASSGKQPAVQFDVDDSDSDTASDADGEPITRATTTATHHRKWTRSHKVFFMPEYRDSDRFWTICRPYDPNTIPNFIGRSLPRKDRGDQAYYCMTMLTLFRPWRSGADLRDAKLSWEDAFDTYQFSSDHLRVMENMHVRYECIDAKDDYFARLKDGGPAGPIPHMSEDDIADLNQTADLFFMGPDEPANGILEDFEEYDEHRIGRTHTRRQNLMSKMRDFLKLTGWTTACSDVTKVSPVVVFDPNGDGPTLISSDWKKRLAIARQAELQSRSAVDGLSDKRKNAKKRRIFTGVDVVDKTFMTRRRKSASEPSDAAIDSIVTDDGLNCEQERAFRVMAQHACTPGSSQLRMYVGGMAGTGKSQVIRSVLKLLRDRGEEHRAVVVAPTGNAASLLGGSTYHYMFGLAAHRGSRQTKVELVRGRLKGVDYIILDEVSMVSCRDLDRIHQRLCEVRNNRIQPFGAIWVIICLSFLELAT